MLQKFINSIESKGRTKNTLTNIKQVLPRAQEWLKIPLQDASYEDIERYLAHIKTNGSPTEDRLSSRKKHEGLGKSSIHTVVSKFMQFYLYCFNQTEDVKYSRIVRKLKEFRPEKPKAKIRPQDLLTPEDIKQLINVATLERDRCIVASLFESGMRMGELLALDNNMIQMNEAQQEVVFNIPDMEGCKTGARTVVCLEIYGYVQDWLKCNPSKKFITLSPNGLRKVITVLFQRSGLNKPHNIHFFRHSAITYAASIGMQQNALSTRFWGIPNSNMLDTYIHLSEQMKASAYRTAKGMNGEADKTIINPLATKCVNCGKLIQSGSLCKTCIDAKKLSEENASLKARLDNMEQQRRQDNENLKKMIIGLAKAEKLIT